MILRLLRLFSHFRRLEADRDATVAQLRESLQDVTTEKLVLQDRLDSVMDDRAKLWDVMQKAIENERATLQMQVNFSAQQRFGVTPFPEAVHLQPTQEPNAEHLKPFGVFQTPSARIAQRTANWAKQHAAKHARTS